MTPEEACEQLGISLDEAYNTLLDVHAELYGTDDCSG